MCCGQLETISDQQYVFSFSLVDATYMTFLYSSLYFIASVWIAFDAIIFTVVLNAIFLRSSASIYNRSRKIKGNICIFMELTTFELCYIKCKQIYWIQWHFCNVLFWTLSNKWRKICEGVNMCVCLWFECTYRVVIQRFTIYIWLLHTLCAYCTIHIRLASVDASFYWMGAPWFGRKYIYPIQ